jgi:hypothetical protein
MRAGLQRKLERAVHLAAGVMVAAYVSTCPLATPQRP